MTKRFLAILAALSIMTSMTLPAFAQDGESDNFTGTPNDTFYVDERDIQWNLKQINMPEVWAKGYHGAGTTICIIDSGLNLEHEDLAVSHVIDTYNVFDGSKNVPDSVIKETEEGKEYIDGHGTYVTGVISAITNNGKGIAGIADEADIVVIKAFDAQVETTNTDTLVAALEYVMKNHPEVGVINMSLGTDEAMDDGPKKKFQDAIDKAVDMGMIVIAAVGNKGSDKISYPAGLNNVIGVGGTDENNVKCDFSQYNNSVFVSAPGDYVGDNLTAGPDDLNKAIPTLAWDGKEGDECVTVNGTSVAAPHVAGVAAIAKSIYPELTANQFKEILKKTSTDLTAVPPEEKFAQLSEDDLKGYDELYGYGLIDADKIITEVEKLAGKTQFEYDADNYRDLKYVNDEEGARVVVKTDDLNASVYIVSYDDNNVLSSVRRVDIIDLESEADDDGKCCRYKIPLLENEPEPSKLFLWNGMVGCKTWPETETTIE